VYTFITRACKADEIKKKRENKNKVIKINEPCFEKKTVVL
jgi:hypothetical protein